MLPTVSQFLDVCRMPGITPAFHLASGWAFRRAFIVFQKDLRAPLLDVPPIEAARRTHLTATDIPRVRALNPALGGAESRRRLTSPIGGKRSGCWMGTCSSWNHSPIRPSASEGSIPGPSVRLSAKLGIQGSAAACRCWRGGPRQTFVPPARTAASWREVLATGIPGFDDTTSHRAMCT